ncbi:hypothetical protein C0989_003333 [Termitomyces sp. Mn162]|nr:hypothetical protein C0989_003333 [Termitomyces sp. Mn162]
MSAYNPAYNPTGYLTNIYSPPADYRIPCHWTPDPNPAFYTPSISQGILLGWHCPLTYPADGAYPYMYPIELLGVPPGSSNSAYFPLVHYYAYPTPAVAPVPQKQPDNYFPPQLQFSAQIAPSPRQQ